jgi:uncharacterized protein (DUF1501 family)
LLEGKVMKRRSFVRNISLGALSVPFAVKGINYQTVYKKLFSTSKSAEDRVLVLIRLSGGNDGLNTVIPLNSYDNLQLHRPNVILPQSSLLQTTSSLGMHPAMSGMNQLFQDGKLTIIQNVGYPEQNRSHFRSMDIWSMGSLDPAETRGWLGRKFDIDYPDYPNGYPNADFPDPFAISVGYEVSSTCQGVVANFSQAVSDPFTNFNLFNSFETSDGTYFGEHMAFLSTLVDQTNQYIDQISTAANAGSTMSTLYDETNEIAKQLRQVAQMISGGLKTKVYILNINGFDTHFGQVDPSDTTVGLHASLLKTLSDAVAAFQDDLRLLGLENRVAGMTFSEFGRQIASNGSDGTDHGDAAPLFIFGSCINGGTLGSDPVIGFDLAPQEALPMEIDFRDIYASVLKDWFEVPEIEIQSIFDHVVTFYPVLGACNLSLDEDPVNHDQGILFPNPAVSKTTLKFKAKNEHVRIEMFDEAGRLAKVIMEKELVEDTHLIPIEVLDMIAGNYTIRVSKVSGSFVLNLVKVK